MTTDANAGEVTRLIEHIPVGLLVIDAGGDIAFHNQAGLSLLGIPVEDLLTGDFFSCCRISEMKEAVQRIRDNVTDRDECVCTHGDRSLHCIASRNTASSQHDGGVILTVEDTTRFQQMDIVKREFLETLLHKLRSPLATVKTSLSLLCGGHVSGLSDEIRDIVTMSFNEVNRLHTLLNDMRDLFVIETGLYEVNQETEEFAAGKCLEAVIKEAGAVVTNGGEAKERIRPGGEIDAVIRGDFEQVKQVVMNVVKNALQFSNSEQPIDVVVARDAGMTSIVVSDQGIGIQPGNEHRIFEKYFREDNDTTRATAGNGLGLFIAKKLLEPVGGTIFAESKPGKGTSVTITIPAEH